MQYRIASIELDLSDGKPVKKIAVPCASRFLSVSQVADGRLFVHLNHPIESGGLIVDELSIRVVRGSFGEYALGDSSAVLYAGSWYVDNEFVHLFVSGVRKSVVLMNGDKSAFPGNAKAGLAPSR